MAKPARTDWSWTAEDEAKLAKADAEFLARHGVSFDAIMAMSEAERLRFMEDNPITLGELWRIELTSRFRRSFARLRKILNNG